MWVPQGTCCTYTVPFHRRLKKFPGSSGENCADICHLLRGRGEKTWLVSRLATRQLLWCCCIFSVIFSPAEVPDFICSPAFLKDFQSARVSPCCHTAPGHNAVLLFRAFFFPLFLPSYFSLSPMPGRDAVLLNLEEHLVWSWNLILNWPWSSSVPAFLLANVCLYTVRA